MTNPIYNVSITLTSLGDFIKSEADPRSNSPGITNKEQVIDFSKNKTYN